MSAAAAYDVGARGEHQRQALVAAAGSHKADADAQRLRHGRGQRQAGGEGVRGEGDLAEGEAQAGSDGQGGEEAKGDSQLVPPRLLDVVGFQHGSADQEHDHDVQDLDHLVRVALDVKLQERAG